MTQIVLSTDDLELYDTPRGDTIVRLRWHKANSANFLKECADLGITRFVKREEETDTI